MNDAWKTGRLEELTIDAQKVSASGKARFQYRDFEGFVEETALKHLENDGWQGYWTENWAWSAILALLYWEVVFARLPGVFTPEIGHFPSDYQDMPIDLFRSEFFGRREQLISAREAALESSNLADEYMTSVEKNYGQRCRLIEDWSKVDSPCLVRIIESSPPKIILGICRRMLEDYNGHRSGFPDLTIWRDAAFGFAEVNGPGDRLAPHQKLWLDFLSSQGALTLLIKVSSRNRVAAPEAGNSDVKSPQDQPTSQVPEGVFWADYIKTVREFPDVRLALAMDYLPLPGAFGEAAIALRALIREKKNEGQDFDFLLVKLYTLAAQHSFLHSVPYIEDLGPGYTVAESIPRSTWENFEYAYGELGYSEFPLLNKTDRQRIAKAWGEPPTHLSALDRFGDVWQDAVAKKRLSGPEWFPTMEQGPITVEFDLESESKSRSGCGGLAAMALTLLALPWLFLQMPMFMYYMPLKMSDRGVLEGGAAHSIPPGAPT